MTAALTMTSSYVICSPAYDSWPQLAEILDTRFRPHTFLRHVVFNHAVVADTVGRIAADEQFYFRIAWDQQDVIGLVLGSLGAHPLAPDYSYVAEQAWWVSDAWRGSSVGARLLQGLAAWGRQRGARWMVYARPTTTSPSTDTKLVEEVVWKTL